MVCNIVSISNFFLGGKKHNSNNLKAADIFGGKAPSENLMTKNLSCWDSKERGKPRTAAQVFFVFSCFPFAPHEMNNYFFDNLWLTPASAIFFIKLPWTQLELQVVFTFPRGEQSNLNHNTVMGFCLWCPGLVWILTIQINGEFRSNNGWGCSPVGKKTSRHCFQNLVKGLVRWNGWNLGAATTTEVQHLHYVFIQPSSSLAEITGAHGTSQSKISRIKFC